MTPDSVKPGQNHNYRRHGVDFFCPQYVPEFYGAKLLVGELIYVFGHLDEVSHAYSSVVFSGRKESVKFAGCNAYLYPANRKNLELFVTLPFLCKVQRAQAELDLLRWKSIPLIAANALVAKATSVPSVGQTRAPGKVRAAFKEVLVPTEGRAVRFKPIVTKTTVTEESFPSAYHRFTNTPVSIKKEIESRSVIREVFGFTYQKKTLEPVTEQVADQSYDYLLAHCSPPIRPYSQQLIGAHALIQAKRLALFYDMRVGKTLTAIMAAKFLLATGQIDRVIVVCPMTNVWSPWVPDLVAQHVSVGLIEGTFDEDAAMVASDCQAFVMNYDRVESRLDILLAGDMSRTMVVLDESSFLRNPEAKRTKVCARLCHAAMYVTLLTGTPICQGPMDVWPQMHCLDPGGVVWGDSLETFSREWLTFNDRKAGIKPARRLEFETMLSTYALRWVRQEADQFTGKDKQFRYVKMRASKPIIDALEEIRNGYLSMQTDDGERVEEMTNNLLRTMNFMREVCCGFNKYRDGDGMPYVRVRHEFDPKLLWVKCFLAAQPAVPLVVFCEWNEQEQRLKEMLDEAGISWSSTAPKQEVIRSYCLKESVPGYVWLELKRNFTDRFANSSAIYSRPPEPEGVGHLPDELATDGALINYCLSRTFIGPSVVPEDVKRKIEACRRIMEPSANASSGEVENARAAIDVLSRKFVEMRSDWYDLRKEYTTLGPQKPYGSEERARQMMAFNKGQSQVFVLKWSQGLGIRLNRQEALGDGLGEPPVMVSLAPTWNLDAFTQGQNRCVGNDPRNGKTFCNMIYLLCIAGSIEEKILTALRRKQDVQTTLLQDAKRQGFSSFIDDIIDDMKAAAQGGGEDDEFFDIEEMQSRTMLGIMPTANLTIKTVNKAVKAMAKCNDGGIDAWLAGRPELSKAYKFLIARCDD